MASGSEDGEIVGEVNEDYDKAHYVPKQPSAAAKASAPGPNSSKLSLLQQLVEQPGWDDEPSPAAANGNSSKRKPKKEKKSKKDKQGSRQLPAAAAPLSPHEQQAANYMAFYGSKVRPYAPAEAPARALTLCTHAAVVVLCVMGTFNPSSLKVTCC